MSLLKAKAKPVTVVKQEPVAPLPQPTPEAHKKQSVAIRFEDDDEQLPIPTIERGSIYDFQLDTLAEKQSRFYALPEGIEFETFKAALRNHTVKERTDRNNRQNFILRDAEKNGVTGIRVFCVSILDKPMRRTKKEEAQDQQQVA